MNNYDKTLNAEALSDDERLAYKYKFLRDKIIYNFDKGSRILKITKIIATVIFLIFTVCGIAISHKTHHEVQWLQAWIILIFLNIIIFVIADYSKYLVESKVIPYLNDDKQLEFGEYDIFLEDIDGENDEEEEKDNEESEEY